MIINHNTIDLDLPPVINILINELLHETLSYHRLQRALADKKLCSELSTQAEWTMQHYTYEEEKPPSLKHLLFTPAPSMNPFSEIDKCSSTKCRLSLTDSFVRSVGLYADRVIVTDYLTPTFLHRPTSTDAAAKSLHINLLVLQKLLPLIREGVLRFGRPAWQWCPSCQQELENIVQETTQSLIRTLKHELRVGFLSGRNTAQFLVTVPILSVNDAHPITYLFPLSPADVKRYADLISQLARKKCVPTRLLEIIVAQLAKIFEQIAIEAFFSIYSCKKTGSVLVAGSRSHLFYLTEMEKRTPELSEIESWEAMRSIRLPWVSQMSAEEIVRLRCEASYALPRLRELLAERLAEQADDTEERAREIVRELRSQALEVESELRALSSRSEPRYRLGMGSLAFTIVMYGLATGTAPIIAASLAGLLATLAHLRAAEREMESEQIRLTSRPAYVLLRAREILSGH